MRNPQRTKKTIIDASCILFNTKGYKATSLSDITNASKLTKGAIYRHFHDKAELEQVSLTYMCQSIEDSLRKRIKSSPDTKAKLHSVMKYFKAYTNNPPFVGGCPLLNAAIESDDTDEKLKTVAKNIIQGMHKTIVTILKNGIKHGDVKANFNCSAFASMMIGALEGGIMMIKLTDNNNHLKSIVNYITNEINQLPN